MLTIVIFPLKTEIFFVIMILKYVLEEEKTKWKKQRNY